MFVLDWGDDFGVRRLLNEMSRALNKMINSIKKIFSGKNELELRLNVEDRGEKSSWIEKKDGETERWFYTACGYCRMRAHVVINSENQLKLACPKCLRFIKDEIDPEEAWLRNNLK